MADEGLKISLILDPGDTAAQANTAGAAVAGIGDDANKATVGLNNLAKGLYVGQNAMKVFQFQAKQGEISFANFGASAGKATAAIKGASAALPELSRSSVSASGALIDIGRVAQDAPFGFIAIQNNIPPLIDSFSRLVKSTGSVVGALKTIGSGLVGFGGIGLAVSLATSALTLFSMASRKTKEDTDKLAESQKTVAQVMKEASASVQGEVATNKALSQILLDTNKSYQARNAALNELKKLGGDYFKTLSIEKSSYEELAAASDKYTNSIIRAAAVKGLQDQISSLAAELGKSVPVISKGFADLVAKNPQDPFKHFGDTVKAVPLTFKTAGALVAAGSRKLSDDITTAGSNIAATVDQKFGKQNELQTRLQAFIDQLSATLGGTDTPDKGKPKIAKDVVTVTDVLADLDKQLLKTNALFVNSGDTLQQLTNDQIKNYQNALAGLIDIGTLPGDKIFDQLKSRLDDLQGVGTRVKVNIPIEPAFVIPPAATNSIFTEELLNTHFRPQVNKFTANLNDLIQTSIEGGIGSISEALGNALVTGDIGSVLKAFVDSIAGFMQKLGVSLIATGVGLEAFKSSLESLNGTTAILAGAGLIVAAGAFRAIAANSFSTGGTAYGPQLAWIGDNAERKEHILSDGQVEKIAQNGTGKLVGEVQLRGSDLVIAISREQKNIQRIN